MKTTRSIIVSACFGLCLPVLAAAANPIVSPAEKPSYPSKTSRMLTCCNPFRTTNPDSILFSAAHFQFEDYKEEAELKKALDKVIKPGMTRVKVEDILTRVAGSTTNTGKDEETIYYRYKIKNEHKYKKTDGYLFAGAWIVGVEYPDKIHAGKFWIEATPLKLGPECWSTKNIHFQLGPHIFSIPRRGLNLVQDAEHNTLAYCYREGDPPIKAAELHFWGKDEVIGAAAGENIRPYANVIYLEVYTNEKVILNRRLSDFQAFLADGGVSLTDLPIEHGFYVWEPKGENLKQKKFSYRPGIKQEPLLINGKPTDAHRTLLRKAKFYHKHIYVSATENTTESSPAIFRCDSGNGAYFDDKHKRQPAAICDTDVVLNDNSVLFSVHVNLRRDAPMERWMGLYRIFQKYIESLEVPSQQPVKQ